MKVNWIKMLVWAALVWLVLGIFVVYKLNERFQAVAGKSHMDSIAGQPPIAQSSKMVPVVVVNMGQTGEMNTEKSLLHGDLYLLMKKVDSNSRVFFNDLDALQFLDSSQQGFISADNYPDVYNQLTIGQFTQGGKGFAEKTVGDMGVRSITVYPEPKMVDQYGQVIGDVLMANGNRYPLQVIEVEGKYLGM